VPQPTREHAWRLLSAALSWAATSQTVPEIQTNGCNLVNEGVVSRRRSIRRGGTGYAPTGRRRGMLVPSWALSPQAVEAIREQMLLRVKSRDRILVRRDAVIVSMQYGLGARNQEIWGMRWMSLADDFAWVTEVLSHGQLDEWGKTEHSTQRHTAMPSILREDLSEWRLALRRCGHPARDVDFIIPGDLGGAQHESASCGQALVISLNQAKSWRAKFFKPAVNKVAERPEFAHILGATPYALREAASRSACEPRTRRPSRASAGRAYKCSAPTTRSQSRTYGDLDHDPSISSGAPHAPHKPNVSRKSKHGVPRQQSKPRNVDGSSLLPTS
jgi:hypothetical protein